MSDTPLESRSKSRSGFGSCVAQARLCGSLHLSWSPRFLANLEAVTNASLQILPVASTHGFGSPWGDSILNHRRRMSHIDHSGTIFTGISCHRR